ncbi:SynN [Musa troglodytarum]|uniref:SynN n=1 Tax=Musa troglodytarum TaxID=320322 RepID=A0A9E7GYV8_9LILI|nr:SynN [Musa troglodytarum]
MARGIRGRLEAMDRSSAANRRLSGCHEGTPVDRTRTAVTNGMRMKLKDLMMEFQALRQRMMAEYKETVERRYLTVTGEAAEEEVIERIIATGESEGLLKKAMLEHQRAADEAQGSDDGVPGAAAADDGGVHHKETVERRYFTVTGEAAEEEVIERIIATGESEGLLKKAMLEHGRGEGEQMDDIEHHVASAAHYVKDGTKELKCAKEYQRSSRKWLCIGIVLLLLLVLMSILNQSINPRGQPVFPLKGSAPEEACQNVQVALPLQRAFQFSSMKKSSVTTAAHQGQSLYRAPDVAVENENESGYAFHPFTPCIRHAFMGNEIEDSKRNSFKPSDVCSCYLCFLFCDTGWHTDRSHLQEDAEAGKHRRSIINCRLCHQLL